MLTFCKLMGYAHPCPDCFGQSPCRLKPCFDRLSPAYPVPSGSEANGRRDHVTLRTGRSPSPSGEADRREHELGRRSRWSLREGEKCCGVGARKCLFFVQGNCCKSLLFNGDRHVSSYFISENLLIWVVCRGYRGRESGFVKIGKAKSVQNRSVLGKNRAIYSSFRQFWGGFGRFWTWSRLSWDTFAAT